MTSQSLTLTRMALTATATTGNLLTSWWPLGVAAEVEGHSTSGPSEEGHAGMGTTVPPGGPSADPGGRSSYYPEAVGVIRDSVVSLVTSTTPAPTTSTTSATTVHHSLYSTLAATKDIATGAADASDLKGLDITTPVTSGGLGDNRGQLALTTALDKISQTVLTATYSDRTDFEGDASNTAEAHPMWLISLMCFLAAVCVAIVVIWFVKRRGGAYSRLTVFKEKGYDYIYRPNGVLDDEYENTFVGVSVPLLQDITVI